MHVTVFGANGFLGRHLVLRLASMPGVTITAFDRFSSLKRDEAPHHPFKNHTNITILPGDFFNRNEIKEALNGADYVFHLISSTTPAASIHDPLVDIDTNIRGTVELLQLCSEANVKKVLYFSSGGTVYGNVDSESIDETVSLAPLSPYAIGKVTIENYLEYFYNTHNLDYISYRIANPYGPGQNIQGKQGVIPIFMRLFSSGEPITIFGDGEMVRDYIYIDDLITMICHSFDKVTAFRAYNIGSGKGVSVNALVKAIEKTSDITPNKHFQPSPPVYVQRSVLNIDRFIEEFDIKPEVKLSEGIERTWKYVKSIE